MKHIILMIFLLHVAYSDVMCTKESCTVEKKMTFWGFDLYHLKYQIDTKDNEHLTLTYLRDITKKKNVEKADEKFKANNKMIDALQKQLDIWHAQYPNVTSNDIFEIFVDHDKNISRSIFNGKELMTFTGTEFAHKYLNIWAGIEPVDDDVKDMILKARKNIKR